MTYAAVCAVFLAVALVVTALSWRAAPHGHAAALAWAATGLVVLTAVFDTVMIAASLFDYAGELISGVRIGLAPIEDFAYPIAALLVCTSVWNLLGRTRRPAPTAARDEVEDAA
ncbi:lycopene cyclase domain-containing protein [Agromyces sp. G08B096]|uniref:Lycopene cyclase domain-containing protein n=1 Tax=Agromyces sp. G08B096 TaxID=3156399 RepID=A0AAU7W697_9MICO